MSLMLINLKYLHIKYHGKLLSFEVIQWYDDHGGMFSSLQPNTNSYYGNIILLY